MFKLSCHFETNNFGKWITLWKEDNPVSKTACLIKLNAKDSELCSFRLDSLCSLSFNSAIAVHVSAIM
jgi:hypothetical protein